MPDVTFYTDRSVFGTVGHDENDLAGHLIIVHHLGDDLEFHRLLPIILHPMECPRPFCSIVIPFGGDGVGPQLINGEKEVFAAAVIVAGKHFGFGRHPHCRNHSIPFNVASAQNHGVFGGSGSFHWRHSGHHRHNHLLIPRAKHLFQYLMARAWHGGGFHLYKLPTFLCRQGEAGQHGE